MGKKKRRYGFGKIKLGESIKEPVVWRFGSATDPQHAINRMRASLRQESRLRGKKFVTRVRQFTPGVLDFYMEVTRVK